MPSTRTSFDNLYTRLNALVTRATGRPCWRRAGIQALPQGPYATVFLSDAGGLEKDVVETLELSVSGPNGETLEQVPWGTSLIAVRVEFYRSVTDDSALQAAQRFRAALRLEERFWDLWQVAGLSGGTRLVDVSAAFRADVEPRAEVHFNIYANVADPLPLADAQIQEIDSQQIDLTHVRIDGLETSLTITVAEGESE